MAGASIRIDYSYDDSEIQDLFDRLILAGADMEAAFTDIGEHLLISHHERYEQGVSPDGTPWEPLDPDYQARKKKNADKILVLDGFMRDLLAYNQSANGLEFGTNQIQGASHQFGDESRGIPQREHIGISTSDEAEIKNILNDRLAAAIS